MADRRPIRDLDMLHRRLPLLRTIHNFDKNQNQLILNMIFNSRMVPFSRRLILILIKLKSPALLINRLISNLYSPLKAAYTILAKYQMQNMISLKSPAIQFT